MAAAFQNRVVFITGGAQGIGAGCAEAFCEAGGSVILFDRDEAQGRARAATLSSSGPGQAFFHHGDVTDFPALQRAIEQTVEDHGRLDCLINNAGSHPPATPIERTSIEMMEDLLRVNYLSTFAGCQFALPHLRKTQGSIVNISSMTAVLGQHHSTAYCATKAAQVGLTKALAIEAGPDQVRVNAILPSNVDTPLMRSWAATLPNAAQALRQVSELQVLGRMATPREIGNIALFLASDAARFLTGLALEADGGAALDY